MDISVWIVWRAGLLYVTGQLWFHSYSKQTHPKCQRCFPLRLMHWASRVLSFIFFLMHNWVTTLIRAKMKASSFLSVFLRPQRALEWEWRRDRLTAGSLWLELELIVLLAQSNTLFLNKGVHHVLMFLFMAPAKIILNSQARQSERKCLECAVEAN